MGKQHIQDDHDVIRGPGANQPVTPPGHEVRDDPISGKASDQHRAQLLIILDDEHAHETKDRPSR